MPASRSCTPRPRRNDPTILGVPSPLFAGIAHNDYAPISFTSTVLTSANAICGWRLTRPRHSLSSSHFISFLLSRRCSVIRDDLPLSASHCPDAFRDSDPPISSHLSCLDWQRIVTWCCRPRAPLVVWTVYSDSKEALRSKFIEVPTIGEIVADIVAIWNEPGKEEAKCLQASPGGRRQESRRATHPRPSPQSIESFLVKSGWIVYCGDSSIIPKNSIAFTTRKWCHGYDLHRIVSHGKLQTEMISFGLHDSRAALSRLPSTTIVMRLFLFFQPVSAEKPSSKEVANEMRKMGKKVSWNLDSEILSHILI